MQFRAIVDRGVRGAIPEARDRVDATATIVRNLLPRLEQLGVSADCVDIETLGARLTAETTAADAVQARGSIVSAWARKA